MIRVVRALGLVTIQDLGRPGHMHLAVPPGGALVAERLIAANRAVHNPDDAAAIEILGALTIESDHALEVATDIAPAHTLAPHQPLTISSEPRRVTYLAVRGGIAAPVLLGGRGVMLSAGLGGPVRTGQSLATAQLARVAPPATPPLVDDAPIRLIPGPDHASFADGALALLLASSYRIQPTSNRIGTRLAGPALPRTQVPEASRPMVLGALEVPPDGQPIVLGPEHPTTGGYPVIAVVASADLGKLFSIRLGGSVRFTHHARAEATKRGAR